MSHFGDNVVSFFINATVKVEEFQVQAALGKAELSEKWEEMKSKTITEYQHLKSEVNASIDRNKDKYQHLKAKMEHLELQLALGQAETEDLIQEQKKKIVDSFRDIKTLIEKE
jgi:hypothetical protein